MHCCKLLRKYAYLCSAERPFDTLAPLNENISIHFESFLVTLVALLLGVLKISCDIVVRRLHIIFIETVFC